MAIDREEVLRSAAGFLSRRPNASQDEIAAAVGISRATLHRYFAGRAALFEALDRLAIVQMRDALDAARWRGGSATEALRRVGGPGGARGGDPPVVFTPRLGFSRPAPGGGGVERAGGQRIVL